MSVDKNRINQDLKFICENIKKTRRRGVFKRF